LGDYVTAGAPTLSAEQLLEANSRPVRHAPVLWWWWGCGFSLGGAALRNVELGQALYVRMHWFKLLLCPILPLGIYLVSGGSPHYAFHRTVTINGVVKIWGWASFVWMLVSAWIFVALAIAGFEVVLWALYRFAPLH
jgi:hypothetical protein